MWIFLGASAVVVAAAIVSTYGKKAPGHSSASQHEAPQPAIQDNTDNNVQDLKNQLAAERQKEAQAAAAQAPLTNDASLAGGTPAQQVVAAAYGPDWARDIVHTGPAMPATRSLCATTTFSATRTGAATGGQGAGTGI